MKTYLQAYFHELKLLALNEAQIEQIVPADCYRLALEIKIKTHKSVSETTIKRVFGFASSEHQPSIYTLNALAEYCHFNSWHDFYTHMEQHKLKSSNQKTWIEVSLTATKISLFTIQSNKHKCGVPYNKTIDRRYIDDFITHFEASDSTVGILSGPAGYGKTIGITKWIEHKISQDHEGRKDDIVLFTNSLSLLQGTAFGYHSDRWLAHLLGFDTSDLLDKFMTDHSDNNTPGKFYLVIDELHNTLISDRQFYTVINQFFEMVSHFAQYNWFRIILVLRSTTLSRYKSLFQDTMINPYWYSPLHEKDYASIPAFSNTELNQLIKNITGKKPSSQSAMLQNLEIINIPLFFRYYYELHGENMDPTQIYGLDEYAVIEQYLTRKVFNGINTTEKQLLMDKLSLLVDMAADTPYIHKKQAYDDVVHYKTAYHDLLYSGILHEDTILIPPRQHTAILFQSNIIAAYFMALKLFNSKLKGAQLISALDKSTSSKEFKVNQLKWLLVFSIQSGDLDLIDQFEDIPFVKEERLNLISFISDGIHRLCNSSENHIKSAIKVKLRNSPFIEYVLKHTCIHKEFETHITKLLDFDLSYKHEVILRSKLALATLLKWEEETLLCHFKKLADIPQEAYAEFPINPFKLLTCLYQYFKHRTVDQSVIDELDNLLLYPGQMDKMGGYQLFEVLIYMLVRLTENTNIAHKYCNVLSNRLKNMETTTPHHKLDFTYLMYGLFLLECSEVTEAISQTSKLSKNSQDNFSYRLLYIVFNIHVRKLTDRDYIDLGQIAIKITEAYGFKLLEAYFRILILTDIPHDEKIQQLNNLKFQFSAFGYTMGIFPNKYG